MPAYQPGLVHAPVTPFTRERAIDFDRYAKLIEFHLANGADALGAADARGRDPSACPTASAARSWNLRSSR